LRKISKLENKKTCQRLIPKIRIILKCGVIYVSIRGLRILVRSIKKFSNSLKVRFEGNFLVPPPHRKEYPGGAHVKVCVDCIKLTQDKGKWLALAKTVIKLQGSIRGGNTFNS
jgi:hypothetical protein